MHPLRESTKSQLLSTLLRADPELFSLCPLLLAVRCARSSPCSQAPTPCFWHLPSLWPQESLAACDKSEGNPPCLSLTPAFASQFLESPFCISLTSFFCPASWTPRALEELRCPALELSWPRTEGGFHSAAGRAGFCLRLTLLPICLKPCCFLTAVSNMFFFFFFVFPPFGVIIMSIFQIV